MFDMEYKKKGWINEWMNEWITRNLLLTGVSDEYLKKAADFISNKIMVEKGKINITQQTQFFFFNPTAIYFLGVGML